MWPFRTPGQRIVIAHLTRMRVGYICVAGFNQAGEHVRPVAVLPRQLGRELLAEEGGILSLGAVIETGRGRSHPSPPEVEDYAFDPRRARLQRQLEPVHFWRLLNQVSKTSLRDIFGPDLHNHGATFAATAGFGTHSLGCLPLNAPAHIEVMSNDRVRLQFQTDGHQVSSAVTDVRLFEADHVTPKRNVIQRLNQLMGSGSVVLSVGLGRAIRVGGDDQARHWFQVNNIHLESDPLGAWQRL